MLPQSIPYPHPGSGGPCKGYKCEFGGECVERYSRAECECPECGGEYQPVCGSDRRTYHSPCRLAHHTCVYRTNVKMIHEGACGKCVYFCWLFSFATCCRFSRAVLFLWTSERPHLWFSNQARSCAVELTKTRTNIFTHSFFSLLNFRTPRTLFLRYALIFIFSLNKILYSLR